jgi:SOS-response transcriptional repressor LexA
MHPLQEKLLQLAKMRDLSKLSYREIGRQLTDGDDAYKRVHPQNVVYHLEKLISAGLLAESQKPQKQQLTYELAGPHNRADFILKLANIPIVGSANCGPADIFADERIEGYLRVSPTRLKSKNIQHLFALRASGDSMNASNIHGESIYDGDFVIVDSTLRTPRDGERVVVVEEELANIKRIYFDYKNHTVILRSESTEDLNPIYVDPNDNWEGLISGTVIQVIKDPQITNSPSTTYQIEVKRHSKKTHSTPHNKG